MFVLCMVCVFVCMFVYGLGPWGEPIMGPWGGQSLIKPTNDHDSTPLHNYRVRKLSMEIFSSIASDYGAICFLFCCCFAVFSSPPWARPPLREYSPNGLPAHPGAFWNQIQPKSSPTWADIRPHFYNYFFQS